MCSKSTNDSLTSACIMTAMYIYIMAECCFRTADPSKPSRRPFKGARHPREGRAGMGRTGRARPFTTPGACIRSIADLHGPRRGRRRAFSNSNFQAADPSKPSRACGARAARVPRPSWRPAPPPHSESTCSGPGTPSLHHHHPDRPTPRRNENRTFTPATLRAALPDSTHLVRAEVIRHLACGEQAD